jgi:AAA+ superfamily predicted ATPase
LGLNNVEKPMRRRNLKLTWSFDEDFLISGSNARIALALLRCSRQLPGALPERHYDDITQDLAPVLMRVPLELKKALRTPKVKSRIDDDLVDADLAQMLQDHGVQTLIGEALALDTPAFRGAFDKAERLLEGFIAQQPHPLDHNVDMLASTLALPESAGRFLRLAATFCYATLRPNAFSFIEAPSRMAKAVGILTGCSTQEAAKIFDPGHVLWRSGLLNATHSSRRVNDLEDLLVLSNMGERLLAYPHVDEASLAGAALKPLPPASAGGLSWPHMQDGHRLITALLKNATMNGDLGVNILIYGEPGTGKTEFVKQVLTEGNFQAYSIDHTDDDGNEASRGDRLGHLRLSRTFAGRHERAVLVVDEAEDIFVGDHHHPFAELMRPRNQSKAWMNDILENGPQPVIWISNKVDHMDPAYLRRFTFCLPFPKPPLALRQSLVQAQLQTHGCSAELMDAIAGLPQTTPALIGAAERFIAMSQGSGLSPDAAAQAMVNGHLSAMGDLPPLKPSRSVMRYDMRYVNLAGAMCAEDLVAWLKAEGMGTALFAGPPGTGKTQLAAELARQLGRKLVVKTASDILSKWYGESERNVAAMFRDCDPEHELLFLDEGDVLLTDRGQSSHRADHGVTAEFLRWLECFEGVFVCATNHAAQLDPAMTRRFTHRLTFLPMTASQRGSLLAEMALGDAQAPLDSGTEQSLQRLDQLTPGDFANVRRRLRHQPADLTRWLAELTVEQQAKPGAASRSMGFV